MLVVHPTTRFKRSFKKIPRYIQDDFAEKIDLLKRDPFSPPLGTHRLHGTLDMSFAFCLRDGYRVLFIFERGNCVVLINIGDHNAYRRWARSAL